MNVFKNNKDTTLPLYLLLFIGILFDYFLFKKIIITQNYTELHRGDTENHRERINFLIPIDF